jgi:plastocyanin
MAKKKYQHKQYPKNSSKDKFIFTKNTIIVISIITALVSAIAYFGVKSMIPVNGNAPVLSAPKNSFVKASHHPQSGYLFVGQSAGGTRKNFSPTTGVGIGNANAGNKSFADSPTGPTLYITKGGLESIHFINEDYDTHSKHNFNIDEFKVHSKDLGYFQSQIITFIVDKDGMFEYFCTIHPEMRGKVVVV